MEYPTRFTVTETTPGVFTIAFRAPDGSPGCWRVWYPPGCEYPRFQPKERGVFYLNTRGTGPGLTVASFGFARESDLSALQCAWVSACDAELLEQVEVEARYISKARAQGLVEIAWAQRVDLGGAASKP